VNASHSIVRGLSGVQRPIIAASGVWSALFALLDQQSSGVVEAAIQTMTNLVYESKGEKYERIIEVNFFDELVKKYPPPPVRAKLKIPFVADTECASHDFEGFDYMWCGIVLALCCEFSSS
jgi:hypothetical protein